MNLVGINQITEVAANSSLATVRWRDRGKAPIGYIKGMAVVYASVYCKLKAGNSIAIEMSKANTSSISKDALAWYNEKFRSIGMDNNTSGVNTLRHLFVLLVGLGMRESSGKHCVGRDRSASNTTSETAEAGLFQTSFNARNANPLLKVLFNEYSNNQSGFLDVFKEGVRCRASDIENFGTGDGKEFQRLAKECPAFAVEFAGVGLRNIRKHWGPINRKEVELRPECDTMLIKVQELVDSLNICSPTS